MTWQQLVKTALLGTENGQLPPEVLQALLEAGIATEGDPAEVLLRGAAVFQQMEKGAFALQTYEVETVKAEADDESRYCSAEATMHLELILGGFYKKALPEFFYQMGQTNKILPPEVLPAILRSSLRSKDLWNRARPFLGNRGAWLLEQNPAWHRLSKRPEEAPESFAYLETFEDAEEEAYFCIPKRLKTLLENYQQSLRGWDWETENLLKIIDFRINMLNAIAK